MLKFNFRKSPTLSFSLLTICVAATASAQAADCQIPAAQSDIPFERRNVHDNPDPLGIGLSALGDFNADGFMDTLIGTKGGSVFWYENPSMAVHQVYSNGSMNFNTDGRSADVDGDGDIDAILLSWHTAKHYWLENNGTSTWNLHHIGDGIAGHDMDVADFDGDGDPDIVVRSEASGAQNQIVEMWRQENPDSWTRRQLDTNDLGAGLFAGDMDADGDADIVINGKWYENLGGDMINDSWPEHVYDAAPLSVTYVRVGDLNGDGRIDIVLTPSEVIGAVSWYEAPADPKNGVWTKHCIEGNQGFLHALGIGDMDNDGDNDIITGQMISSPDPDEVIVYQNKGGGASWEKQLIDNIGTHGLRLFDLGNDGDLDIFGKAYFASRVDLWENKSDAGSNGVVTPNPPEDLLAQ